MVTSPFQVDITFSSHQYLSKPTYYMYLCIYIPFAFLLSFHPNEFEFELEFKLLHVLLQWPLRLGRKMLSEQQSSCWLWSYFLEILWCGLLCQLILTTLFGCLISWLLQTQLSSEYKVRFLASFVTCSHFLKFFMMSDKYQSL